MGSSGYDARTTGFLAAMSAADVFGLVASVIVCLYLLYALLRGEKF
jgi:F subunit of K+-transporting ATPase (Potass_KdpF)